MADDDDIVRSVVIDNGSGTLKAGWSGEDVPEVTTTTVVGRPAKQKGLLRRKDPEELGLQQSYIGDDALLSKHKLELHYPMERGRVTNWDDMTSLWEHAYSEMSANPSEQPVLLTEPPYNSRQDRAKMAEIFYEGFEVPKLFMIMQAVCSLYSSGRTTGLVIDSGDGVTHTVPCYSGFCISHAVERRNYGGRDVTNFLQRTLFERGYNFSTSAEVATVKEIKEKLCYVAQDYKDELAKFELKDDGDELEKSFTLPDGQKISLGNESFRAPEILFNPEMMSMEAPGLHELVYKTLMATEVDLRKDLMANIVLSGGNTMFEGLGSRLREELVLLAPGGFFSNIKVSELSDRYVSVWIGASILSSLGTFKDQWISREQYQEEGGEHLLHKRCI